MISITYFNRKPAIGAWSLERVYKDVQDNLPNDFVVKNRTNRYYSSGIISRILDTLLACKYQGDINHVTGGIHYVTYLLNPGRTVLTILDCDFLENSKGIKKWLFWLLWLWIPEKRCQVIVTISQATRKQVLQALGCNPNKVKVIYCNLSKEFEYCFKVFNSEKPRVLHLGTAENKNLKRHVDALVHLHCQLIIIGVLSSIQKKYLAASGIDYINYSNLSRVEILEQYKLCDILLFASTYEGFGLPIIEAQAVGRPVITSNLWSMPEVAGDAACLVDPFNELSIRTGLERMIKDDDYRKKIVCKGLENVKRFTIDKITADYSALYRAIAKCTFM